MRDLGPVCSSTTGAACARALITMSIGFSTTLSIDSETCSFWLRLGIAVRLSALEVISANGVVLRLLRGSGESGGSRDGIGGIDGTADERRLLAGAVLFRFRGDAFLVGEAGSLGVMLSSGSNIWEGSMPSPVFVLLPRVVFLGDSSTFAVVCRLVDLRGLARLGAGVNSSSLSSLMRLSSSSDSSSTTTGLRVARRDGLTGDSIALVGGTCEDVFVRIVRVDDGRQCMGPNQAITTNAKKFRIPACAENTRETMAQLDR